MLTLAQICLLAQEADESRIAEARCGETCSAVVMEVGKRKEVPGISIRVGTQVTESDASGQIQFSDEQSDALKLTLLDPYWQLRKATLSTQGSETRIIWVEHTPQEALGTYAHNQVFSQHTLETESISTMPGSLQDPLRAIQNLPGAARTPMNAGWLLVRGTNPEATTVLWEGLPLSQLYHLGGFASIFHPKTIDTVTFNPIGWVHHASGLGGQVELSVDRPDAERRVEIGLDLINATAYVVEPIRPGATLFASARHSWLRGALAIATSPEQARIAPQFSDWSIGTHTGDASFLYLGFIDGIDAPTADGEQILHVQQSSHQVLAHLDRPFAKGTLDISTLFATEKRSLSDSGQALSEHGGPHSRAHIETTQRAEQWFFRGGIDIALGLFNVAFSPQEKERYWGSGEGFASLRFGRKNALEIGLRNTHLTVEEQLHRFGLDPAIRTRIELLDNWNLQAQLSSRHQAPNLDLIIGDPEGAYLPLQRVDEGSGGIHWESGRHQMYIAGYQKAFSHLALRESDGTMGSFTGKAYGVESFIQVESERFQFALSTGFGRSIRQESDPLDAIPDPLDPGIQCVGIASWTAPRGWILAGRFRYASGVPFQSDRPTALDLLTQQEILLKPTVNPATGRLPDPHAIDVKIAKRRTYKNWRVEAYLDIQNLYNRRVPEPILTGFEEKPIFGFGMPVLPVFGVEGSFWPRS